MTAKYQRLRHEILDQVSHVEQLCKEPSLYVCDHIHIVERLQSALCLARELENIARGTPAPEPAP